MQIRDRSSSVGLAVLLALLLLLSFNVQAQPTIKLEITTHLGDGQVFVEGDTLSFLVSSDSGAYLLIVYLDASGNLIQLLPNAYTERTFFEAAEFVAIPDDDSPYAFTVSPPFGAESIFAFASTDPFPQFSGQSLDNGLRLLSGDVFDLKRNISRHNLVDGRGSGHATLAIETRSKIRI